MNARNSSLTGAVVIAVGVALLLDNMGLLGNVVLIDYFPLIATFYGVLWLSRCRRPDHMIWPGVLVAGGILGTLGNLHIIHLTFRQMWPLILIAVGLTMLIGRFHRIPGRYAWANQDVHFASGSRSSSSASTLDEVSVFGEIKRAITSQEFAGGSVKASFGAIKVDLRKAGMVPGKDAIVDCNASFGGIEFKVPETWRVVWQGSAVFGAFDDKTLPPRPEPGVTPPTLVLTGTAAFGGIEVRN